MPNMGRKKTQMEFIDSESARHVTFSKRRSGLFKKASELCTMCAVEVAIIIFSIGGKAFSFGHPNVQSVFNRLRCSENPDASTSSNEAAGQDPILHDLNKTHSDLIEDVGLVKKLGKKMRRAIMEKPKPDWFYAPRESLSMEVLYEMKEALEDVQENVRRDKERLLAQA